MKTALLLLSVLLFFTDSVLAAMTAEPTKLSVSTENVSQDYDVSSYGGSNQDRTGTVDIRDAGLSLFLEGNRWQKIDFPYTVTADTVIEFDFQSTVQGEVHGLGFDNDLAISPNTSFKLYGTQNWGLSAFATYTGSGTTHFTIPVGEFYTGNFQYLFFINDDDSHPTGNSLYSNIVVYENTTPVPVNQLSVSTENVSQDYDVSSYGGSTQDVTGTVDIRDAGLSLFLEGNRWQKIDFPYTVSADTVIEFDFQSTVQGEIHGLGFDTDLNISENRSFRIHGTQSWGISDFDTYTGSGTTHFTIPVGEFYTGHFQYLFFINDDDSNAIGNGLYSNIVVYEKKKSLAEFRFDEVSWDGNSGEVIDETGSFSGQAINGAFTSTETPALAGNPGTCGYGSFDGANDYIALPNSFENLQDSFTVTAWINPSNVDTGSRIFADDEQRDGQRRGFGFSLGDPGNGKLRFYSRNISPISVDTTASITPNTWTFVAAVHNSVTKTRQIFINGVAQTVTGGDTSNTYTGTWGQDDGPTTIGGETDRGETRNRFTGSIDELRVYKSALNKSQISTIFAETHACNIPVIHHYEIVHDGQGLTCDAETITVNACADASCSNLSTEAVTLDFRANGALVSSEAFTGSTSVSFSNTTVETLTFSVANPSITASNPFVCDDGSGNACDMMFSDAGFVFYANGVNDPIGTQISGKRSDIAPGAQSLTIKAVKSSPADPGVCEALISNASADIGIAYHCVNPSSCATSNDALTINSTPVNADTASPFTEVTLLFNATGEATFTVSYADAGLIALSANADLAVSGSAGTANVQGDSNTFVVKPAGLCVQATAAHSDCASGDASCSKYIAAGIDFDLDISGRVWVNSSEQNTDFCDNAVALNYVHSGIGLASHLVSPGSGVNAALSVAATTTDTSGSVTQSLSVDEVGVFTFTATAPAYFTETIAASTSANVGRFIPNHFELTGGSVAAANTNTASFTYLGQPVILVYSLTAKSALSPATTTQNYEGTFANLDLDSVSDDLSNVGPTLADKDVAYGVVDIATSTTYNGRLTVTGPGASTSWNDGVINVISLPLIINRSVSIEAPSASINIGLLVEDSDGVKFPLLDLDSNAAGGGAVDTQTLAALPGSLLYGRVFIPPVYGPEIPLGSSLNIAFFVQYFDGNTFITNPDDSSTDYSLWTDSCADTDLNDSLLCNEAPVAIPVANTVAGTGDTAFPIAIARPGLNNSGGLNITIAVDDWLTFDWDTASAGAEYPTSLVTFGKYRGHDRIIYWREKHTP